MNTTEPEAPTSQSKRSCRVSDAGRGLRRRFGRAAMAKIGHRFSLARLKSTPQITKPGLREALAKGKWRMASSE